MYKTEIVKKLKEFLQKHQTFSEECEVVYLMSGIRKILDHDIDKNIDKNKTLRLYANLAIHNELTLNSTIKFLSPKFKNKIDYNKDIKENAKQLRLNNDTFLKQKDFKTELITFFHKYNLNNELFKSINWHKFINLYFEIVKNCKVAYGNSAEQKIEIGKNEKGDIIFKFFENIKGGKLIVKVKNKLKMKKKIKSKE